MNVAAYQPTTNGHSTVRNQSLPPFSPWLPRPRTTNATRHAPSRAAATRGRRTQSLVTRASVPRRLSRSRIGFVVLPAGMATPVRERRGEADRQRQPERNQTEHQRGEHRVGGTDPGEGQGPGEASLHEPEPARREREQAEELRGDERQQEQGRVGLRTDGVQRD